METGNTHVTELVDAVHHEMDGTVYSHCAYKSMYLPVKGEQLI